MSCKICLKDLPAETRHAGYHDRCIRTLFSSTKTEPCLPFTRAEFMKLAPKNTKGFSISGVQVKLQGYLDDQKQLSLNDHEGIFIIKPCPEEYEQVPENEHLSMELARLCGFKVPACGLIPFEDQSLAYIIRRYDRLDRHERVHQEDLTQLMGISNDNSDRKYTAASYYDVLKFIQELSGDQVQALEYFRRQVFTYLVGNGDGHLKNTSFLLDEDMGGRPYYRIAPVYDVVNTEVYEDIHALSLDFFNDREPEDFVAQGNGYYSAFDFIELGVAAGLAVGACKRAIKLLLAKVPQMAQLVEASHLSKQFKDIYQGTLASRSTALARGA